MTSTYYVAELRTGCGRSTSEKPADAHAGASWTALSSPSTSLRQLPAERGADALRRDLRQPVRQRAAPRVSPASSWAASSSANAMRRICSRSASRRTIRSVTPTGRIRRRCGTSRVRTDRAIGRLLDQVDKIVGLQHTLVAFTTDHGVAPVPESLRERGLPGGRMTTKELFDPIQQALAAQVRRGQVADGDGRIVAVPELRAHREARSSIPRRSAASRRRPPPRCRTWRACTRGTSCCSARSPTIGSAAASCAASTPSGRATSRSSSSRTGCARRRAPRTAHPTATTPTSRSSSWAAGSSAGEYSEHVALNDLAPTLATLAGVEIPAGSSGRVLTEALRPFPAEIYRVKPR